MRTHGTLSKWNDDKGFGFINPADGGKEIFVHISAFPRDGVRPKVGEVISFDLLDSPDGKKKAHGVMRPGSTRSKPSSYSPKPANQNNSSIPLIAAVLGVIAIGGYGFSKLWKLPIARHDIATAFSQLGRLTQHTKRFIKLFDV